MRSPKLLCLLSLALVTGSAAGAQPLPRNQEFVGHQLKPPIFAMDTPSQVTGAFYADLSGILLAKVQTSPPLWQQYLSARTGVLFRRLAMLDDAKGRKTFEYDWLCQCRDNRRLYAVPEVVVEQKSQTKAWLQVTVRLNKSQFFTMRLFYVNENGWRLDDIEDPDGRHLKQSLIEAIRRHESDGQPLAESNRPGASGGPAFGKQFAETIVP